MIVSTNPGDGTVTVSFTKEELRDILSDIWAHRWEPLPASVEFNEKTKDLVRWTPLPNFKN